MDLHEPFEGHEHATTSLKVLLLVFCILLLATLGYFVWIQNTSSETSTETAPKVKDKTEETSTTDTVSSQKTYSNVKHSFSVSYPTTWTYREFPDTKDGAGFRLATSPDDLTGEFITVGYYGRSESAVNQTLEDYAKTFAINEIEGHDKLISADKVTTPSGIVGYLTKWQTSRGTSTITVFPTSDGKTTGSIWITLQDSKYATEYETFIKTFSKTN